MLLCVVMEDKMCVCVHVCVFLALLTVGLGDSVA